MTAQEILGFALQGSIMLTVLGLGLGASISDATFLFRQPALLLRCVLSMSIIMPVVVTAVATMLGLSLEVKAALIALSVSPVPPILQKKQLGAGGRPEFVTGLLVAMSALAIVLVPLSLAILDQLFGRSAVLRPADVAKIMLSSVFVPLAVGLFIRHFVPAAERASSKVIAFAGVVLGIAAVALLAGLWPQIRASVGNGQVLIMFGMVLLGLIVGQLLGGPFEADRTALALATASRHPAVALAVATSGVITEAKAELTIILLYLIVATLVSIPYLKWRQRGTQTG